MRDLGPQYRQPVSLCDALDRVLHTGVVALGEVTISVADVDLLYLGLQLVITSIETSPAPAPLGNDWPGRARMLRGGPGPELPPQPVRLTPLTAASGPSRPAPAEPAAGAPGDAGRDACATPRMPDSLPAEAGAPGRSAQKNGLGQLVLALVKLLHELLERQALRRMQTGSLSVAEMERLGVTLQRQAREIERLASDLGLTPEDLNLDLGPLGKLL